MNQQTKDKLYKGVEFLTKLHFRPQNIMVTGSVALDIYGMLPEDRDIKDVDLIVKMDDKSWGCMKLLEAIYSEYEIDNKTNSLFFNVGGVILNIFRYDGGDWSNIKESETGIFIASFDNILNVKKNRGFAKDTKDICDICKKILV